MFFLPPQRGSTFFGRARLISACAPPQPARLRGAPLTVARNELESCPLAPVIDPRGWVFPVSPLGTNASIFAVYDASERVQYIGFSKELRTTLRLLLCRRPELCHSYRAYHYAVLDQQDMMMQRDAWFAELGAKPPGNAVATETAAWQGARQFGSREEAVAAFAQLEAVLRARGLAEDLEADEALLAEGKLDAAPSACNTEAALTAAVARRAAADVPGASRSVVADFPGAAKEHADRVSFNVFFQSCVATNGGHMVDVLLTPAGGASSSTHRIIVGREYSQAAGCSAEELAAHALAWLLHRRVPMQTEGILTNAQFPVNYFAVSQVEQWWPEFGARHTLPGASKFWRFNRIHKYGAEAERFDSLMLGPGHLSELSAA